MADPIEVSDLKTLKAELLRHEIRSESATADLREIELAIKRDQERDRMVMGGHAHRLDINSVITSPKLDAWIDALEHWEHRDPAGPLRSPTRDEESRSRSFRTQKGEILAPCLFWLR